MNELFAALGWAIHASVVGDTLAQRGRPLPLVYYGRIDGASNPYAPPVPPWLCYLLVKYAMWTRERPMFVRTPTYCWYGKLSLDAWRHVRFGPPKPVRAENYFDGCVPKWP